MRWIWGFVIFVAGVGLGVWLAGDDPSDDQVEVRADEAGDVIAPAPPAIDELVADRNFSALAARVSAFGEFQAAIDELPAPARLVAIDAWVARAGASFSTVEARVTALMDAGRAGDAIALLLESAALVAGPDAQQRFEAALAAAVDTEARRLTAAERLDELDALYERITLTLPELGVYFLKLGTLRVQAGDEGGALAVLSQIQQHPRFGESARSLLADVNAPQPGVDLSLETLSLTRRGDQFIVDGVIDDGGNVSLLIDTGASMTVIARRHLEALGYSITGPTAYFSTAGGVVEGPVITLSRLSLGAADVRQLPVGVLPVDFPGDIDGLLGMNFLRHFEFRIDQEAGELLIDSPR